MLFLLSVLYIPEVEKVFRGIENLFRIGYTRASSDMGEVLFCGAGRSSEGTRGGRPPAKCNKNICFRLTLQEYQDLRRAAIAEGCSMADILRQAVQQLKRNMKVRRWGR